MTALLWPCWAGSCSVRQPAMQLLWARFVAGLQRSSALQPGGCGRAATAGLEHMPDTWTCPAAREREPRTHDGPIHQAPVRARKCGVGILDCWI